MKTLFSIFHKPAIVIPAALVIAFAAGAIGYRSISASKSDIALSASGVSSISAASTTVASSGGTYSLGFLVGGRVASVSAKIGDRVKKGQVLAALSAENTLGALTQARAAYASAQANFQKVQNGASSPAIDVAKAAVNSAQVNLDQAQSQQSVLVANAYRNLLNSKLEARPASQTTLAAPAIGGTYSGSEEGTITLQFNQGGTTGGYIVFSGLASGQSVMSANEQEPLGSTGLTIEFPSIAAYAGQTWTIAIPNTDASNYLANYNAYQSALQAKTQALAAAQAALDQAKASLAALVAAARPEDIAASQAQVQSAYGALQIAEAAYSNTVITAPADGTITAVSITPGQIALPNASVIELR